jgi:hypothetical protein
MNPHALLAFESPATAPAWADKAFEGRRAYIRTLDDCCNPPFLQDAWIKKTKVHWNVVDIKSGHMPFESQPELLSKKIVDLMNGFLALEKPSEEKLVSDWGRFYVELMFAIGVVFTFGWLYWI